MVGDVARQVLAELAGGQNWGRYRDRRMPAESAKQAAPRHCGDRDQRGVQQCQQAEGQCDLWPEQCAQVLAMQCAVRIDDEEGGGRQSRDDRSEEHTSELQSLMRSSYAVFCLKKKTQ